jgi:hypothetical protein
LHRVLVAGAELDRLDALPAEVGAVVEEDPARTIARSVERNLDLDSTLRARNRNALVRNELRAAMRKMACPLKIEDG